MDSTRPFTAAALFAATTGRFPAQSPVSAVTALGPGGDPPATVLLSTLPVVGGDITFLLDAGVP